MQKEPAGRTPGAGGAAGFASAGQSWSASRAPGKGRAAARSADTWQNEPASRKTGIREAIAARFEHTFQHALLGIGSLLVILGAAAGAIAIGSLQGSETLFDALSQGFTQAFLALFSGVVAGVGAALFLDGLILALRGNRAHVAASLLLAMLCMLAAFFAVANAGGSTFASLAVFFAGVAASGALFMSAAAFCFSSLMRSYLSRTKE